MQQSKPLTPREKELAAMPTIASQLPISFANGSTFDTVEGSCGRCDGTVDKGNLTGSLSHPYPAVFVLEAMAFCPDCNVFSRFDYRLHDDMRMTGKDASGKWAEWPMKYTLSARIRRFLFGAPKPVPNQPK
jgi:hypothetical protein